MNKFFSITLIISWLASVSAFCYMPSFVYAYDSTTGTTPTPYPCPSGTYPPGTYEGCTTASSPTPTYIHPGISPTAQPSSTPYGSPSPSVLLPSVPQSAAKQIQTTNPEADNSSPSSSTTALANPSPSTTNIAASNSSKTDSFAQTAILITTIFGLIVALISFVLRQNHK